MKQFAINEITSYLSIAGLDKTEISALLARFLEEEAQEYIDAIALVEATK